MADPGEAQSQAEVLAAADVGQRVVRGGAARAAGFVATNLLTAAGAVLLLRALGVDDFGRFGTVMALIAIIQGISEAGLTLTGSRELAVRPEDERAEMLAHVLGLRIALTAGGVVVAVVFAAAAGYDRTMVLGTAIAGFGIVLQSVQTAMLLPLSVELRNGTLALNEVLRQGSLVATWAVVVVAGAGLLAFFAAQVVAGVILLLATPLMLARRHFVAPRLSRDRLRELAVVGLPVAASTVIGVVYLRLLVILFSIVSDNATQLGYYVTSTRVIELFVTLPFLLSTVILPVLSVAARDDRDRLFYAAARTTEALALGGVLIAVVLATAAEPLLHLLGGAQYEGAAPVLRVQALALVPIFIAASWTPLFLGASRLRGLVIPPLIGMVVVIAVGLALIPVDQARGAAIAAVLGDGVLAITAFIVLRTSGLGGAVPGRSLGRLLLAGLPAAAIAVSGVGPPVVRAVVAAAVLLGLALALRIVPSELLDPIRARLRPRRAG